MTLSLPAPTFSYQKQTVLSDYFAIKYIAVKLYNYCVSAIFTRSASSREWINENHNGGTMASNRQPA